MSFIDRSRPAPRCDPCDIFFRTWQEKRDHDTIAHDRYQSTDIQRGSWNTKPQGYEKSVQDYFVCFIHAKKLNEDFRCPVRGCDTSIIGRKSVYLQELRTKTPDI